MSGFGLRGIAALRRYTCDLVEATRYLRDVLDFREVARSSPGLERESGERSIAFAAGECCVVCTTPLHPRSRADRYLSRHPEGIGEVIFLVEDAPAAHRILQARGGTPTGEVTSAGPRTRGRTFSIATPMDAVDFRFVEQAEDRLLPGFDPVATPAGSNRFGFRRIDHLTANFRTIAPMVLWAERVLGLRQYWRVEFHGATERPDGTGLRSIVLWDEDADIKIATNEPLRPNFEASQVALFCEDQRGAGIQHAALEVRNLPWVVRALRDCRVPFAPSPGPRYYAELPDRLDALEIGRIDESIEDLSRLGILVDGTGRGRYLLQIFMEDAARFGGDPKKTPFFFELIERKGCRGFGENNFRTLFEAVERAQRPRAERS